MKEKELIISRHARALKNQVGTYLAIDECEDIMASMMNEAINYTNCCKSGSELFSFADMRDAFDYASVSSQRRDGMTFKEWMSKR